jgi:hypothetical protein
LFSPYRVLLSGEVVPGSVVCYERATHRQIPGTDFVADPLTGNVDFVAGRAGLDIVVTYRPRLAWRLSVRPSEPGLELCVTVGRETKQVYALGAAGMLQTVAIEVLSETPVDQLNLTVRRANDVAGPFVLELGDWRTNVSTVGGIRYTITSGATQDYDWASSGMLVKPLWPCIELLRARLDGTSLLARYLDSGKMLI